MRYVDIGTYVLIKGETIGPSQICTLNAAALWWRYDEYSWDNLWDIFIAAKPRSFNYCILNGIGTVSK